MKYPQIYNDEWIIPIGKFKMACCDCGLVHRLIFKVIEGKVIFKAIRDNRATGQIRRHNHIKIVEEG